MKRMFNWGVISILSLLAACAQPSKESTPSKVSTDDSKVTVAQTNEVIETIMARRSIRKYKTQPVEAEKLQEILKCGINAPNGMYKQSWQIRVVQNPEFLAEIDKGFMAYKEKTGMKGRSRAFYGAPCLIFVAYDLNYDLSQIDCGLLGENIMLAAQSLGLGTCCLGQVTRYLMSEDAQDMLARLAIPATHKLVYAISLGYPDEAPAAKPRDMQRVKFID